ncbi:MAG: hypothetical protein AAGH99_12935 [Planctomycetota bacterium]
MTAIDAKPGTAAHLSPSALLSRNHFVLRRLHSLSGVIPIGMFVCVHLFTNAQMIWGQDTTTGEGTFQHEVDFIHKMPYLLFIEISLWGAIAFHAILGLFYTFTGKGNLKHYSYGGNIRYMLQRVTGIIALVFIFLHIATLRWRWDIFGWYTPFYGEGYQAAAAVEGGKVPADLKDVPMSLPLTAYALQFSWVVVVFYVIGTLSAVFHWSNGLWTAAISWGLTITSGSMKRWGMVCAGMFVALTAFFSVAIYAAMTFDFADMTAEQREMFLLIVEDPAVEIMLPAEADASF